MRNRIVKYIIFESGEVALFSQLIDHKRMNQGLSSEDIKSAGFASLYMEEGHLYCDCYGSSFTLNKSSAYSDSSIILKFLGVD